MSNRRGPARSLSQRGSVHGVGLMPRRENGIPDIMGKTFINIPWRARIRKMSRMMIVRGNRPLFDFILDLTHFSIRSNVNHHCFQYETHLINDCFCKMQVRNNAQERLTTHEEDLRRSKTGPWSASRVDFGSARREKVGC
jgi:hypothetical protein